MKAYNQIVKATFERLVAIPAQLFSGLVYYITGGAKANRPYIDDGTNVDQIMMEKHLPEARRDTNVLPDEGGTGKNSAALSAGNVGDVLAVNAAQDGYDLVPQGSGGVPSIGTLGTYLTVAAADAAITALTHPQGQLFDILDDALSDALSVPYSIVNRMQFQGDGCNSTITGDLTYATGSNSSGSQDVTFDGNITVDSGVLGLILTNNWQTSGNAYNDNSGNQNCNAVMLVEKQ